MNYPQCTSDIDFETTLSIMGSMTGGITRRFQFVPLFSKQGLSFRFMPTGRSMSEMDEGYFSGYMVMSSK